jgi:hypothetical protein
MSKHSGDDCYKLECDEHVFGGAGQNLGSLYYHGKVPTTYYCIFHHVRTQLQVALRQTST